MTELRQSSTSSLLLIPATNCFLLSICPHLCTALPSSLAQIASFLIHIRRSKLITASLPALHPYGQAHLGGGCLKLMPLSHPHPAMCGSQEMTFGHYYIKLAGFQGRKVIHPPSWLQTLEPISDLLKTKITLVARKQYLYFLK